MNMSHSEITDALLNVRKAYRLLHDFQRAALDAASYIGNHLDFSYEGGYPRFTSCSPRSGKGWLGASAWDWLNFYYYEFHFRKQQPEQSSIYLSILLFCDTAYYLNHSVTPVRDDPATYPAAEQSDTKVGFLFYRQWQAAYDSIFSDREQIREFLTEEKLSPALIEGGVWGKVCDFSRLASQESADQLVKELALFGEAAGFLERDVSLGVRMPLT